MADPTNKPLSDRYQVLALSGGGYRGLFGAAFLSECEANYEKHCRDQFDLIAGTSIGALLAAGLALGVPARKLRRAMIWYGPKIFGSPPLATARRFAVGAPYNTKVLERAIDVILGKDAANTPLSQIDQPLLICAVNHTRGETTKFMSRGLANANASNFTLAEAILASAAAPTFFPLKKFGTDQFADGGLVANAPDMVALIEIMAAHRAPLESIYTLSIGTASRRKGAALHEKPLNPSAFSWFFYRGLVQTTMAAQEDLALHQARILLGDRHVRIDEEPTEAQAPAISSLDKAGKKATETLLSLASAAFARTKTDRKLRSFF